MEEVNKKMDIAKLKLKTGDLLVCDDLQHDNWGLFSWFIKFMTMSDFSHVGMVVKLVEALWRQKRISCDSD